MRRYHRCATRFRALLAPPSGDPTIIASRFVIYLIAKFHQVKRRAPKVIIKPPRLITSAHSSFLEPKLLERVGEPKRNRTGGYDNLPFKTFPETDTGAVRLQLVTRSVLEALVPRNEYEATRV